MNVKSLLTTLTVFSLATLAHAQLAYRAIDLTPAGSNAAGNGVFAGQLYGALTPLTGSHAAVFSQDGSITDLHPGFLDTPAALGRTSISGQASGVQVGSAFGAGTGGRLAAMAWHGTADSATFLSVPFANMGSQAVATDGQQIVGQSYTLNARQEDTSLGPSHALLWDVATGTPTDLTSGGNGSFALGVGGGKQVGYEIKTLASAVMWSGTARSMVSLHPKNFDVSVASATDGVVQVGYAGVDVQVFVEKRGRRVRFNYGMIWSGTASSAQVLDKGGFRDTYATGTAGGIISGYGVVGTATTTTGQHAVAWTVADHLLTDLHASLPAGFDTSTATGVDAQGNISGTAVTATGERHAILWVPVL